MYMGGFVLCSRLSLFAIEIVLDFIYVFAFLTFYSHWPVGEFSSLQVEEKGKDKDGDTKEHKKKHQRKGRKHRKESSSRHHSDSEEDSAEENNGRKSHHHKTSRTHDKHYERRRLDLDDESKRRESHDKHYERRRSDVEDESKGRESHDKQYERRRSELEDESKRRESHDKHYERRRSDLDDEPKRREGHDKHYERRRTEVNDESKSQREPRANEKSRNHSPNSRLERENLKSYGQEDRKRKTEDLDNEKYPSRENEYQNRRRKGGSKLSEEERASRLKEMQMDAEVHEEQRWRRLKKADETDAVEADKNKVSIGKSFLDDANKSVYGVEKGGSSTIEESVRRRSYYSQRGTEAEGNAFRRWWCKYCYSTIQGLLCLFKIVTIFWSEFNQNLRRYVFLIPGYDCWALSSV